MWGQRLVVLSFFLALSCLPEIDDDLPTEPGRGGGGPGGTGSCEGACCPSNDICYPDGDKTAPGGECLATRDNRGKDRVQIRTTWTRTLMPEPSTGDITYQFLRDLGTPPLPECNQFGVSGYILLYDWDRTSADITEHVVRTGYSAWFGDGPAAMEQGLCFFEAMYSDPDNGWTDAVHIKPTTARRVAEDFVVDEAFLAEHRGKEEGVFYYNDETGEQHGYAPKAYLVIHESENNVFIPTAHDVETRGKFNDPAVMNCQGRFRSDVLDPANDCRENGQTDPGWGCIDDGCEVGMGPTTNKAHFLIEELETVYVSLLQSTLCVQYMGQPKAIEEGWADPSDWGLNCSGSPRWQAGERPRGDWCHATNSPATDDCHDSYLSAATGTGAAVNIRDETCMSTAQ